MHFKDEKDKINAKNAVSALREYYKIATQINSFLVPLLNNNDQEIIKKFIKTRFNDTRIRPSLNLNTETGRLSCRNPNLHNQPITHVCLLHLTYKHANF